IPMSGGIASKHPDLTILHFAHGATVLSRDAHGVLALFDEARLLKHEDPIRVAHLLGHEVMVVPPHLLLIPVHITDKPLQPTDAARFDRRGNGLVRLALELAELAHNRVKERGARLTAGKTVVEGRLKRPQFLHDPFHIAGDEVKRGNGKAFTAGPTRW